MPPESYRISPQQKRALEASGALAWSQCAVHVHGGFQSAGVTAALRQMAERHEMLRTSIQQAAGITLQAVSAGGTETWIWGESDLADGTPAGWERATECVQELARASLDPAQGRVLAASRLRVSEAHSILCLTVPAVCGDARSLKNLASELIALVSGGEVPPSPAQYVDFAEWQNGLIDAREASSGASASGGASMRLPFERPGGADGFTRRQVDYEVRPDIWERLELFCRETGISAAAFLLGCWQVVLSRYVDSPEVKVDVWFDGRKFPELEAAVGPLARAVPLAVSVGEQVSAKDLFRKTFAGMNDIEERLENISFAAEQQAGVGFEFQTAELPYASSSLRCSVWRIQSGGEQSRLKLACLGFAAGAVASLQFDPDRFDERDIRSLGDSLLAVIESAVEAGSPAASLRMLTPEAEQRRARGFTIERVSVKPDSALERIEHHARVAPDSPAVRFGAGQLTYRELDRRAERLAERLRKTPEGGEPVTAVLLERSVDSIAAMLGAWKAGTAFAMLDPALPEERLRLLLGELRPRAVVTREKFLGRIGDSCGAVVVFEPDLAQTEGLQDGRRTAPNAQDLAYVLFTSGSTGLPKPVGVEHRNLSSYIDGIYRRLELEGGESFAAVSTLSADLAYTAVFGALCNGGCLHLIPAETAFEAPALAEYFAGHPVDCLKITPSHLTALLECRAPERILPRKRLILGGEVCDWRLTERIGSLAPACRVFNHYGPTETTIGALAFGVANASEPRISPTVPIGRPLPNVEAYVLDGLRRPTPDWVPGELYLGGATLSRGYMNSPELNAERFVDHSFREDGARLYRTGDRVRLLPGGNIEFLGRYDSQLKIRGYRIEPGEIEAALRRHPAVREAAVIALDTTAEGKQLAAYVTSGGGVRPTNSELHAFVARYLPEYMLPAKIAILDRLPLTVNGKIDRAALAAASGAETQDAGFPRTHIEKLVARAWEQALGIDRVGIHENFFDLGGDSILSIQVIARLNRAGLRLTARQFLENQTVAELAAVAGAAVRAEQGLITGAVPLTPIQHWFFEQDLPELHHYNQAMFVSAVEQIDPAALSIAAAALLRHHDALRLRFTRSASGWEQYASADAGGDVVSFTDYTRLPEAERKAAMESDAAALYRSFDLASGPLVKIAAYRLGGSEPDYLLFAMHHLVADAVSWRILWDDLADAYRQARAGPEPVLPAKTTSFREWALTLQSYANSQRAQSELTYWRTQELGRGGLPRDFSSGENTRESLSYVRVSLSADETRALLQNSSAVLGARVNEILVAAMVQSFASWTGVPELAVELEAHGREDMGGAADVSRTVGWFTSRYPVRLNIDGSGTRSAALAAVRQHLRAVPQNGIGYGVLRYLSRDHGLGVEPRPEVSFNYLGQFDNLLGDERIFCRALDPPGPLRTSRGKRPHLIDVVGAVRKNCLEFNWSFSRNVHNSRTIQFVADEFLDHLRFFAAESSGVARQPEYSEFSGSIDKAQLESMIRQFEGGN